jgi:hypothetical protein
VHREPLALRRVEAADTRTLVQRRVQVEEWDRRRQEDGRRHLVERPHRGIVGGARRCVVPQGRKNIFFVS